MVSILVCIMASREEQKRDVLIFATLSLIVLGRWHDRLLLRKWNESWDGS
ncbi:hypothetical protein [Effusibacillus pohliae]|nr:hypothetical protein [Effusibacillus pohliae]